VHADRWSYEDVAADADDILERVRAGTMPCDGAWPQEQTDVFAAHDGRRGLTCFTTRGRERARRSYPAGTPARSALGSFRFAGGRLGAVLREIWDRITGRSHETAVRHEAEREHMSREERRVASESVEDLQADEFVDEHLGAVDPERLLGEDEPPRS